MSSAQLCGANVKKSVENLQKQETVFTFVISK